MMDKAEQPTITQADRDAAEAVYPAFLTSLRGGDGGYSLAEAFARHRTTSLAAQEVDSGMSGDAVERAEWFWTNLPTGRKWTGLATNEKALVCHQIARITPSPAAQDGLVEALRDALAAAYVAGATDVHNAWVEGVNGGEPDFGEAGWDYAHSIALSAIKEQHHD